MRKGLKLLLPSPRKKSDQEATPLLETPDQIRLSIERDQALITRAQRERNEIAVARDRFKLGCDKIIFGFQLSLAITALVAALIILIINPELVPVTLLGGGGLSKIMRVLRRADMY
jgi:hypothetical protein